MESAGQLQKSSDDARTADASQPGSARRHRRRRHGRSRDELHASIDQLGRQRMRWAVTAGVLALCCLALTGGLIITQSTLDDVQAGADAQRERLERVLRDNASQLSVAKRELRENQERIRALVDQRIPGLRPVEMYSAVPIANHHVRDITFQPLQTAERKGLEYKIVVENTSSAPIKPSLSVELFDEVGVQLTRSKPAEMMGDEPPVLRAGEIRSFFAVLETDSSGPPTYFRLVASN